MSFCTQPEQIPNTSRFKCTLDGFVGVCMLRYLLALHGKFLRALALTNSFQQKCHGKRHRVLGSCGASHRRAPSQVIALELVAPLLPTTRPPASLDIPNLPSYVRMRYIRAKPPLAGIVILVVEVPCPV